MKFIVTGERRKVGSSGRFENFIIPVDAASSDFAREVAREEMYRRGYEHVHTFRVSLIDTEEDTRYDETHDEKQDRIEDGVGSVLPAEQPLHDHLRSQACQQ